MWSAPVDIPSSRLPAGGEDSDNPADAQSARRTFSSLRAGLTQRRPEDMDSLLDAVALLLPLLDAISGVVFFIKDGEARYLMANQTLATRCGFKNVDALLGKTSAQVFPSRLGVGYIEQDFQVMRTGVPIEDQLELHFYSGRKTGWCLTQKLALYDRQGRLIGMAGISHDLQETRANHPSYQSLLAMENHIRLNFHRPVAMEELTRITGLSVAQIERYCKRIFQLTPRQIIHKIRLEKATELLSGALPITDIALQCGYTDHSAFSRQFKAMTGTTPSDFRASLRV
ncbi:AraC family transcriptional regulator [Sodalis ligni]|jgi:AraC-like DNA-binding protein|uniref:AraC family transcriptional regulator n=1 Tax=Sodalis ligni TaxID=2697027 RepID=UPI00193EDE2C|nr:AraC family transcriptional regulator [Sodalis ligni]QWA13354.1 AraC family transcriptional regulator [Sodalis ligni]